ncbi:hypothetical protein QAD02_002512 [Eretmocerus hayati]|uniref:Uncharacterized protein n=1 Tax=Eretmocerus hayati TaxID=131215 RepID=A0ACC2NKA7_9HYME|nr:hypothetical protein QAD02_002512 [Eretmocerus hayati]
MPEKCSLLRADLEKLPYHIYGDHSRCQHNYFDCNGEPQDGEHDVVPELQQKGLFEQIQGVMIRAINHAHSLLMNLTTNRSESFNNIVVKTIGAKRLHLSLKLSYKARCHIAVLLFDISASIAPICEEMGKDAPQIGVSVQKKRAEKNLQRLVRSAEQGCSENCSPREHQGEDENYGRVVEPDISEEEFAIRKAEHYEKIARWQRDAEGIEQRTRLQSSWPEWKTTRKWVITASIMGRICRKLPHATCASIVKTIVYRPELPKDDEALMWGIAHEVVVKQKLREAGHDIRDCGIIMHPQILGIAASSDGLIGDDGTLEIKCPYTARMVKPLEAITDKVYNISKSFFTDNGVVHLKENSDIHCQMQGQLAVTGR